MTRFLFAPLLVLVVAAPSFAQDMPLSQILIDGEGWKKVEKPGAKPKPPRPAVRVFAGQADAVLRRPDSAPVR